MLKKCLSTLGFYVLGTIALIGQAANRPVPDNIPRYEFVQYDSSYQGYYLTTPFRFGFSAISQPLIILDSKGYLFWYAFQEARNVLDFKYDPATQLYQFVKFQNPLSVRYCLMDAGFIPVDSFTTANSILPDVHDFQLSNSNTVLLAGALDTFMDLSAYQFNGTQGSATTRCRGFVVQEFDLNHQLLFQWNSNEHIHPGTAYSGYDYNPALFDYCHGNSIEEDFDGNLLLSFRNLDAVYKIDRTSGEVLWRLGGNTSSFVFTNDAGFSGQHDARRLPNGNIALFDNANMAPAPRRSRAVEYRLDTVNWTATKVWEYVYTPAVFSSSMGGHQTTPDRRHLINYGQIFRPDPSIVLIDDAGNKISALFFQDSVMSYRSYLFDLPLGNLQRPVIQCTQQAGVVTLSAPLGFEKHAWSTGETTTSISVQFPGTYQLWVNHGAGMLGSEPLVIENMAMGCPLSKVAEPDDFGKKQIVGWYDLLGRQVAAPQRPGMGGRLYLVRYADGTMELRFY